MTSQTLTHFEALFNNFRSLSYQEVLCHMAKNTSWILAQVYLEGEAEPHISFILFIQVIQIYKLTPDIRKLPFWDWKLRGKVIVVIFQITSFEHTFRFTWYFAGKANNYALSFCHFCILAWPVQYFFILMHPVVSSHFLRAVSLKLAWYAVNENETVCAAGMSHLPVVSHDHVTWLAELGFIRIFVIILKKDMVLIM
jgi:hypothetical protein